MAVTPSSSLPRPALLAATPAKVVSTPAKRSAATANVIPRPALLAATPAKVWTTPVKVTPATAKWAPVKGTTATVKGAAAPGKGVEILRVNNNLPGIVKDTGRYIKNMIVDCEFYVVKGREFGINDVKSTGDSEVKGARVVVAPRGFFQYGKCVENRYFYVGL